MHKNLLIKDLNKIAIPLIINAIFTLTIGIADQAMISRISISGFASIGIVSTILFLIAGIIGNVSIYFNLKASELYKSSKTKEFRNEFANAIFTSVILGVIFTIILFVFGTSIVKSIYNLDLNMEEYVSQYLKIMSPYFIFQLLSFTFGVYFKITEKTHYIIITGFATAILNLSLNYILIFGNFGFPKLGVNGAAIASITSIALNVLICIYVSRKDITIKVKEIKSYFKSMFETIKFSIPLFGEEIMSGTIFTLVITSMISRMGVNELAAYIIIIQFVSIIMIHCNMYGNSMVTIIGKYKLGNDRKKLKVIVSLCIKIVIYLYIILSLLIIVFRNQIPYLITDEIVVGEIVSKTIVLYIIINLFDVLAIPIKYTLNSIGKTKFVFFASSIINISVSLLIVFYHMFFSLNLMIIISFIGLNFLAIYISFIIKYKLHLAT